MPCRYSSHQTSDADAVLKSARKLRHVNSKWPKVASIVNGRAGLCPVPSGAGITPVPSILVCLYLRYRCKGKMFAHRRWSLWAKERSLAAVWTAALTATFADRGISRESRLGPACTCSRYTRTSSCQFSVQAETSSLTAPPETRSLCQLRCT